MTLRLVILENEQNPIVLFESARAKFATTPGALEAIDYLQKQIGTPVPSSVEGSGTVRRLAEVFEDALNLAYDKTQGYGEAWRDQGWMGNLARVMSKSSRLRNMLWRNTFEQSESMDESVEDTALDMINLLGFMLINRRGLNPWGRL